MRSHGWDGRGLLNVFLHPFGRNSDWFRQSPDTEKGTATPSDHAYQRGKMGMHIPSIQLSGIAANNAENAQMDRAIRIHGGFDSIPTDNAGASTLCGGFSTTYDVAATTGTQAATDAYQGSLNKNPPYFFGSAGPAPFRSFDCC